MFYIFLIVMYVIFASFPIRFWLAVHRFGRLDAAIRSDAHMLALDFVTVVMAVMPVYWAVHSWFGFTVPGFNTTAEWQTCILAVFSTVGGVGLMLFNGVQRFEDGARAGMPEAALRWLATRQIITVAEISNTLSSRRIRA